MRNSQTEAPVKTKIHVVVLLNALPVFLLIADRCSSQVTPLT